MVIGDDFTVRGGSADANIKEKHVMAERRPGVCVPIIRMIEGSGGGGSVKTIETTGRANVPGGSGWEWVVQTTWALCRWWRWASARSPGLARPGSPPRTTR